MPLSDQQISTLLRMVAAGEQDPLDCDGCFEHLAEFAEKNLQNQELPAALQAVETHLEQCPCCEDEYQALLEALRTLET